MSEHDETLADIVAEMRSLAKPGETYEHTYELLCGFADRLKAAAKRECATTDKSSAVGNAAAIREASVTAYNALEKIRTFSLDLGDVGRMREFNHLICLAKNRLDAALALPRRQCDVGKGRRTQMNGSITTEETYHISNIMKHYAHARQKHPYFCDIIKQDGLPFYFAEWHLEDCRKRLVYARAANVVQWDELLDCEKYEAMVEIDHGHTAHAVEELYDCVAVLLRTIDVLEGRQTLGKPETKGASA